MPAFGFDTVLGYVNPTFETLLVYCQGVYETESGVLVDLEQESPTLDLLRTQARLLKALYDDGAGTYASGFVGSSTGAALQNLLSPFIGAPLAEVPSTVTLPLAGIAATVVTAGSTVTTSTDGPNALPWILQANVVIPNDGVFAYSEAGPKSAIAGSGWAIQTPVAGWATAGPNVADAAQGRLAETPIEYRKRFSASTLGTRLLAAVLAVPGVTAAQIFENPTDNPDSFWGATHWVELLVQGGDDTAIADAIQATRCFTVQTVGGVIAVVTALGFPGGTVTIKFSRPALVNVWITSAITKGEGYSTDTSPAAVTAREDAIKDQLVAWGATRTVGLDLTAYQASVQVGITPGVPGVGDVLTFVGLAPAPVTTTVVAGPRDLLVIDVARIVIAGA